jgi:hypothetical protein
MLSMPNNSVSHQVQTENLVSYLAFLKWREASNERWFVFTLPGDTGGDSLEIAIPRRSGARDSAAYLQNAVEILSALRNEPQQNIIRRIRYYDTDVLTMRNLESDEQNSITLKLAATQVPQLKRLVEFSACSEEEPRTFFNAALSVGDRMVQHYRFGHTVPGSFSFTVESRIIHEVHTYTPRRALTEPTENVVVPPIERRIMERIVRGLVVTQDATRQHNPQTLVKEYSGGFNANMCDAVADMVARTSTPLEYSILWSPKVDPSRDVTDISTIRIGETSQSYLREASRELRKINPERETISGMVVGLSSRDDPRRLDVTDRSIILRWTNRQIRRPINVIFSLGREEYAAATKAHLDWKPIQVSGILVRTGSIWRLVDPSDFHVLG